jgi:prepilin-type N-terminal cleavage/methylation domain-containing protein
MKGFTLIEAMVAVAILAISVTAPTYGASRTLVATQNANNQLTASYLAQEGVEYARVYRDSYYLTRRQTAKATASVDGWTDFKNGALNVCSGNAGCSFDSLNPSFVACSGSCPKLNLRKSTGEYTTQSGAGIDPTIYTRTIKMSLASPDEARVTSTVSWDFHGKTYRVEIVSSLTRWLP